MSDHDWRALHSGGPKSNKKLHALPRRALPAKSRGWYIGIMAQTLESDFGTTAAAPGAGQPRSVPWQIWIVVALLALEGVGNFFAMFDTPAAAWWLFAKVVFITGLIKGWQWVFWIFLAAGVLHVVYFLQINVVASLLNLLMIGLTFSARDHFFLSRR
jgi:hypothetical protein